MDVILSIKPIFIEEIVAGRKTFELRKKSFKKQVRKVYIYASSPICRIVGEFIIGKVLEDTPNKIWSRTCNQAGITKDYFDEYYKNRITACALEIKCFRLYDVLINPHNVLDGFTPPQSFCYVNSDLLP